MNVEELDSFLLGEKFCITDQDDYTKNKIEEKRKLSSSTSSTEQNPKEEAKEIARNDETSNLQEFVEKMNSPC